MNPATDKEHYYVRSNNSRWEKAPDDVVNALKTLAHSSTHPQILTVYQVHIMRLKFNLKTL